MWKLSAGVQQNMQGFAWRRSIAPMQSLVVIKKTGGYFNPQTLNQFLMGELGAKLRSGRVLSPANQTLISTHTWTHVLGSHFKQENGYDWSWWMRQFKGIWFQTHGRPDLRHHVVEIRYPRIGGAKKFRKRWSSFWWPFLENPDNHLLTERKNLGAQFPTPW